MGGAPPERLFLFDVDGTLVRVVRAGRRALEEAFRVVLSVDDPVAILDPIRFDGNTDRAILAEAVDRLGLDRDRFATLQPTFEATYLRGLEDRVSGLGPECVLPGVTESLQALREAGCGLGLLTGNSESGARTKLAPFGLNRFFPGGAFGSEHLDRAVMAGGARRHMEEILSRAFRSEDVFVVGDSVMDVRCGKAHGFSTIAVCTGWTSPEALRTEEPDLLLPDLRDLLPRLGIR
jgi:phosphoglycolate phosphatase